MPGSATTPSLGAGALAWSSDTARTIAGFRAETGMRARRRSWR
jgi:hypothetical protein